MVRRIAPLAFWRRTVRRSLPLGESQAGGAAVEFAFALPVFLLLLIGIVECGRAVWTNYSLQTAVDDTARYVLANPTATDAQIITYVGNKLDLLDGSKVTVTVTRDTVSGVNFVAVSAAYAFSALEMIFPAGTLSLSGRSRVPLTDPT